jgi:hypothetical protein
MSDKQRQAGKRPQSQSGETEYLVSKIDIIRFWIMQVTNVKEASVLIVMIHQKIRLQMQTILLAE